VLRSLASTLLALASRADQAVGGGSQKAMMDAAAKLSRTVGLCAIDRTPAPADETRRRDTLWAGNGSFAAYFRVSSVGVVEESSGALKESSGGSKEDSGALDDEHAVRPAADPCTARSQR